MSSPMKTQTENLRAVKSCQLQSIFHFYNIAFLNLRTKFTKAKNQLKVTKHIVVNKSSCRSLQLPLREKSIYANHSRTSPFGRENDLSKQAPIILRFPYCSQKPNRFLGTFL